MRKEIRGLALEIGAETSALGKALSEVEGKSKELEKQLRDVDKALKLDPTNVTLLAEKEKILQEQFDNTTEKLTRMKEAKAQVDEQFNSGKIDANTYRAFNTELGETESKLKQTSGAMQEGTQQGGRFSGAMNVASTALRGVGEAGKFSIGVLAEVGKAIGGAMVQAGKMAATGMVALGGASVATGKAIYDMTKEGGQFADDVLTMSAKTGIGVEALQELEYAARFVDVEVETMAGAQQKLVRSMVSAEKGTGAQAEAFNQLGVSIYDSNGELRNQQDVFADSIDALGKIENETERNALAQQLFGRSAAELNPLIEAGGEELARLRDEARKTGQVVSEDAVKALGELDDQMQKMDSSMGVLKKNMAGIFAPAVKKAASVATEAIQGISGALSDGFQQEDVTTITNIVSNTLNTFATMITSAVPTILSIVVPAINTIVGQIVQLLPTLLPQLLEGVMQLFNGILDALVLNAPAIGNTVSILVTNFVNFFAEAFPKFVEAGFQIINSIASGLADNAPQVVNSLVTMLQTLGDTIIQNLPMFLDSALQIIIALAEGLVTALPNMVDDIVTVVMTIADFLIDNIDLIIDAGLKIIVALAEALLENAPKLVAKGGELIGSIVTGLVNALPEIGKAALDIGGALINGIIEGLGDIGTWIYDKISGGIGRGLDKVKNFFGIHSPSTYTRDHIGVHLGTGVGVGTVEGLSEMEKAMTAQAQKSIDNSMARVTPGIIPVDFAARNLTAEQIRRADIYSSRETSGSTTTTNRSMNNVININLNIENFNKDMDHRDLAEEIGRITEQHIKGVGMGYVG